MGAQIKVGDYVRWRLKERAADGRPTYVTGKLKVLEVGTALDAADRPIPAALLQHLFVKDPVWVALTNIDAGA